MSAFLLGSLSSLVSASLGFWAGFLKKAQEDSRRRKAIATALLFELRPLERMLRVRAEHTRAAESTVKISMPVYDRFESDIILFPADTVQTLLELRAFVRDIETTAITHSSEKHPADENAHHYVRLKAAAAANLIPPIRRLLEDAGGHSPVDAEVELYPQGKLPPLSAPAFPNAAKIKG
jgi:hypothetical protein